MTSPALCTPAAAADLHVPSELPASAVLLDLDGTITDSAPAITSAIAETLSAFGYAPLDAETLLRFVGPPIREGFRDLGGVREADLEGVVAGYRERYAVHMLSSPLFPGISELIQTWHAAGVPLAVATAKVQTMAEPIIDSAGLTPYFTAVCGALPGEDTSLGGIDVKANVIARALARLAAAGADVTDAVMVGDRYHDVEGATAHGVTAVLAGWGYGRPGEEDGAHAVAQDVAELGTLVVARTSAA